MMTNAPKPRPIVTRIIEQSIPGIVVALLVMWRSDSIQEYEIKNNRERIQALEKETKDIKESLTKEMASASRDLSYIKYILEKYEQPKPKRQ